MRLSGKGMSIGKGMPGGGAKGWGAMLPHRTSSLLGVAAAVLGATTWELVRHAYFHDHSVDAGWWPHVLSVLMALAVATGAFGLLDRSAGEASRLREYYLGLWSGLGHGVVTVDRDGFVTGHNPAWVTVCDRLGIATPAVGRRLEETLPAAVAATIGQMCRAALGEAEPAPPRRLACPAGESLVELEVAAYGMRDGGRAGRGVAVVAMLTEGGPNAT